MLFYREETYSTLQLDLRKYNLLINKKNYFLLLHLPTTSLLPTTIKTNTVVYVYAGTEPNSSIRADLGH